MLNLLIHLPPFLLETAQRLERAVVWVGVKSSVPQRSPLTEAGLNNP